MANISKANRTADPKVTRNGRPRLKLLNLAQAKTALEKAGRGRDKNKIRNRIVLLENRAKKLGVADLVTTTTNDAELV
jgi:hypothetical protein